MIKFPFQFFENLRTKRNNENTITGSPLNGATNPRSSSSNCKQGANSWSRTRPGDRPCLTFLLGASKRHFMLFLLPHFSEYHVKQVFVVSNQPMGRAQAPGVPIPTQGMVSLSFFHLLLLFHCSCSRHLKEC